MEKTELIWRLCRVSFFHDFWI